jgi:hypothetical protein
MINQFCSLERRTARGGKDSVDHPVGQHDDCANAVAGFAAFACNASANYDEAIRIAFGDEAHEANPRPKRLHPNLTDEAFARIMTPPAQIPWDVTTHHDRRMAQERIWLEEILASRVTK